MKRSVYRTTRRIHRSVTRTNFNTCRVSGARWSSTREGGHQWSTPLAKQLAEAITTTGPIPVASFMRQCLTSDLGGYYSSNAPSDHDQFGAKGDFVTSPEISQIFGELIGIWFVAEWIAQGRRREDLYLMELGPGRGTLMDDILRTIRNFPDLTTAIDAVYLIESSPRLREAQHKLLCGDRPLVQSDFGYESTSKHSEDLKIVWAEDLRLVPKDASKVPFVIAHEFFDALPIHIFQSEKPPAGQDTAPRTVQTPTGPIQPHSQGRQKSENQWRELMVSPKPAHRLKTGEPEFELSSSRTATAHSMYLPELSSRYQELKSTDGATIEVSPESQSYTREVAIRLGGSNPASPAAQPIVHVPGRKMSGSVEEPLIKPQPSGAALFIDYGPASTIPANSLRGIRSHKRVSPFQSPGIVDISADVDFLALAESAIKSSPGVEVHGPVDQARFLTAMGIEERAAQLVKRSVDKERGGATGQEKGELTELVKRVESGWKRLVDRGPQGMGRLYQVLAIVPHVPSCEGEAPRRPVGFGGDVKL